MEYYDQIFEPLTIDIDRWSGHEFEQCTFKKLDLTQAVLNSASFVDCRFENCNLTRAQLKNTKLYEVRFIHCQLPHVDFGHCDPFGFHVNFQGCQLDYTTFLNRKLKKASFIDCSIREAFFLNCELVGTSFTNCNLELTKFDGNDLTQADFSSSYHLIINPEENKLKKARFSLQNLPGLLKKYDLVINK
ncbi:pentapeptide repeat-containing protein [Spirosoma gilvum]